MSEILQIIDMVFRVTGFLVFVGICVFLILMLMGIVSVGYKKIDRNDLE